MNRKRKSGIFRLLDDYQSYQKRPAEPARVTTRPKPAPGNGASNGKVSVEREHFDQGEPIALSHWPVEDIHYEPVQDSYAQAHSYLEAEEPLRYDLEYFGDEVEAFSASMEDDDYHRPTVPADEHEAYRPSEQPQRQTPQTTKPEAAEEPIDLHDDNSFEADLRAILSGKKKVQAPRSAPPTAPPRPSAPPQSPAEEPRKNDHAIFEKIAQSMKLANAYELGALELEQRFDDFDAQEDKAKKKS